MTERLAWGKFSWSDWENDPALSLVSVGAQGFWMRLLCIAVKEGGYVRIGGEAPPSIKLAKLVRATEAEVDAWIAELESERVFSRMGDGTIYSRRMLREVQASRRNRDNGAKGGNPKLRKDEGIPPSDNPPAQPPGEPLEKGGSTGGLRQSQKREEKIEPDGSVASPAGDASFEHSWAIFPDRGRRRSSRAKAKPMWARAAKAAGGAARLVSAIEAFARSEDATRDGGEYVPAMDRWLRDGRWEHYLPGVQMAALSRDAPQPSPDETADRWRRRVADYRKDRWWQTLDWGEAPGRPGCEVPPEILAEFGYTADLVLFPGRVA